MVVKDASSKEGRIMQRAQEGGTGVNKQRPRYVCELVKREAGPGEM
jgi:hypothetical protein